MPKQPLRWLPAAVAFAAMTGACREKAPPAASTGASVQTQPSRPMVPAAPAGVWSSWTVADTGLGPVTIGMTPEQANAAVDGALELPRALASDGCDYAFPRGVADVGFMIEQGMVVRVDVRHPDIRTAQGAGVGDSEARIEQLYAGRLRVSPHKYAHGHYYAVLPADTLARPYRVIFETEQGVVTAIRAGRLPQVEYVEGCS